MKEEYTTLQTRFAALSQLRVEVEGRAMHGREGASTLAAQARAAYQGWKQATATLEAADASAYDRYQARAQVVAARHTLEQLIGVEETAAVFDRGEPRPWLHG